MVTPNETAVLLERAELEARSGNLTRAHVLRSEALYLGAEIDPSWAASAAAITDAQSASLIDTLAEKNLRVASIGRDGEWAYRSVKQYKEKPQGPILAVTNQHPNRLFADSAPRVGDDELRLFTHLPALMAISLKHAEVTDLGLGALTGAPMLRHLSLAACHRISGPAIAALKELRQLSLELHPAQAPLDWLKQLNHLERLTLVGFSQSGDDIFHTVSMMPSLRSLAFGGGFKLGEAQARKLTTGSGLHAVEAAKRLPHLTTLDLSQVTNFDDDALLHLVALPSLTRLVLGHHPIASSTRERLMAVLPGLAIETHAT